MPLLHFLVQRKSSAHRIAAKALFRALLLQSRASGLGDKRTTQIQNVIRNRFKENRHNTSKHALPLLFRAGYETIDHLDAAAVGDEASKTYLIALLKELPAKVKRPPHSTVTRKQDLPSETKPEFPVKSIFDRPRPLSELSGRRHVPRLISAASVPVLRIKKPQPYGLGAFVRNRQNQRERRHKLKASLDVLRNLGDREDEWDDILSEQHSIRKPTEETWTASIVKASEKVKEDIAVELDKNIAMAARMQGIVDAERELAKKERQERLQRREKAQADVQLLSRQDEKAGADLDEVKTGSTENEPRA